MARTTEEEEGKIATKQKHVDRVPPSAAVFPQRRCMTRRLDGRNMDPRDPQQQQVAVVYIYKNIPADQYRQLFVVARDILSKAPATRRYSSSPKVYRFYGKP